MAKRGKKTARKALGAPKAPKANAKAKANANAAKAKAKAKAKARKAVRAVRMAKPAKRAPAAKPSRGGRAPHAARFDRGAYDVPVMDLGEAIAVATALLAVAPARTTLAIAEEAAHVAAARDRARAVLKTQGPGPSTSVDARAYDVAMDRAWATFVRRIQDHVELPAPGRAGAPDGASAPRVYAIVRDLSILKLNYLAEFAQIGARLDALKREGLLEAAGLLAGAVFLEEVLRCHGEYGQALGVTAPGSGLESRVGDGGEARIALIEAIAEYAVQVMAQARAGREESWAPVQAALKPLADLRVQHELRHRTPDAPASRPPHPPVERFGADAP